MAKDGNKSSLRKPNVCPETPEETGATINKNIACSICKKKIVLASFNRHIEETHGNPRLKNCEICSYKTTRNHHLKRHIDAKHQNKKEFFCCPACDKKTTTKHNLKRHFKTCSKK